MDVIVSGWIAEAITMADGRRYVFSFQVPGDFVRLNTPATGRTFVAITNVTVGDASLLGTAREPSWAAKLAAAASREEERLLNHLVRIGRLTAPERVLNMLLELYDRLERVGLAKNDSFRLPITQQMLGDALGLSLVHMNRTLQKLRRSDAFTLSRGVVTLHDRPKLAAIASYEASTFDETPPPARSAGVSSMARSWMAHAPAKDVAVAPRH